MYNPAASNTERSQEDNGGALSSSLSILPNDVILNCLSRIPRQNYAIISQVSKSFRSFVHSPELRQMRVLIGKEDYPLFYICFEEDYMITTNTIAKKYPWFSFDPNEKQTNDVKLVPKLSQENLDYGSSVSIGSTIYFVGGNTHYTQNLWIFNSWSGELCKGPNMKVGRILPGVAVLDKKLYVMGGHREENIQLEVFDMKTQTWEVGPLNLHGEIDFGVMAMEAVSIEEKVYGMGYWGKTAIEYDTKDGQYETIELPLPHENRTWRCGVCVINNVMFAYYFHRGLMWYDSEDKLWRMVQGLDMDIDAYPNKVIMVECKGKLGFLWQEREITNMRIWCVMIELYWSGVEIHGTIEWCVIVGDFPQSYFFRHWRCLSISD